MSALEKPRYFTSAPPGMGPHGACRESRGNTMGALVHGSLVFYDDEGSPPTPEMLGELVIAAVKGWEDAPYVRFLELGSKPGRYTLRSTTGEPLIDVELSWAALVKWIRLPTQRSHPFVLKVEDETLRRGQVQ